MQDSPHKIFIGGLPNYLNEDQVKIEIVLSTRKAYSGVFVDVDI